MRELLIDKVRLHFIACQLQDSFDHNAEVHGKYFLYLVCQRQIYALKGAQLSLVRTKYNEPTFDQNSANLIQSLGCTIALP